MTASERDIVERDDVVVVVDENGVSHKFEKDAETSLVPPEVENEIFDWLIENSEYTVGDTFDYPLDFSYSFHLEDTVDYRAACKYNGLQEEVDGFNFPSIELHTDWNIDSNGNLELQEVRFNGVTFTPS